MMTPADECHFKKPKEAKCDEDDLKSLLWSVIKPLVGRGYGN